MDSIAIILYLALLISIIIFYFKIKIKVLKSINTKVSGKIKVVRLSNGELSLTLNEYPQGVSVNLKTIKNSYWAKTAQKVAEAIKDLEHPQILMLGLGANTIPKLIRDLNNKCTIIIIEIDDQIISLCKEFFNLKENQKTIVRAGDAYKLVKDMLQTKSKYDVIIVDMFIGIPPYVSPESSTPDFINDLKQLIEPEGQIIFNRPAYFEQERLNVKELKEYLNTQFKELQSDFVHDSRGYKNDIISLKYPL